MNLLFIAGSISADIMRGVCWTLLHSLWQGLIVASTAGLIIIATRHSKAALRYNLLCFVFAGFIVGTIITFLSQPGIINSIDSSDHTIPLSGISSRHPAATET